MKSLSLKNINFLIILLVTSCLYAQTETPLDNQLYKKRLVKAIDLREKQNQPLFAKQSELPSLLMDYVNRGLLTIYKNDSLTSPLKLSEFKEKLNLDNTGTFWHANGKILPW